MNARDDAKNDSIESKKSPASKTEAGLFYYQKIENSNPENSNLRIHRDQEFIVILGTFHAVFQEFHRQQQPDLLSRPESPVSIRDSVGHFPVEKDFVDEGHIEFQCAAHGVQGVFKVEARDEESAKNMRDVVNGLLALAKMQADGQHGIVMIAGDGEHGAAGICYGAALGGGRVLNATSSQGLLFSLEQLPVQAGTRVPMVLNVAARAVSGPLDIRGDHSDLYFALNTGWIVLCARDPQAVYDMNFAAVRIGALDMAAANLFGSNLFNIAVLGFDDILYRQGPILLAVSRAHMATLSAAILMTGIAIVGLTFRARRKRYRLSWDAMAMVGVYVLSILLLARLD